MYFYISDDNLTCGTICGHVNVAKPELVEVIYVSSDNRTFTSTYILLLNVKFYAIVVMFRQKSLVCL
jgi:hypothetical protein